MRWSRQMEERELNVYVEKLDDLNGTQVNIVPFGGGGFETWNPTVNEEPFFDDLELWHIVQEGLLAVLC